MPNYYAVPEEILNELKECQEYLADCDPGEADKLARILSEIQQYALKNDVEEQIVLHNRGNNSHRFRDNPEELRFAVAWDAENGGQAEAIIRALLGSDSYGCSVSDEERIAAASAIQWLGSPVGQSFLEKLGYTRTR